jgi:hypothetical protein
MTLLPRNEFSEALDIATDREKLFQAFAISQRLTRNSFKLLRHRNGLQEIISNVCDVAKACEKLF